MFKFLSNENKGESICQMVRNDCEELLRHIITNESFITTVYPHTYTFNGEEYTVDYITFSFDDSTIKIIYNSRIMYRNYIVNLELDRNLHDTL
jgi:hypothetical protein